MTPHQELTRIRRLEAKQYGDDRPLGPLVEFNCSYCCITDNANYSGWLCHPPDWKCPSCKMLVNIEDCGMIDDDDTVEKWAASDTPKQEPTSPELFA